MKALPVRHDPNAMKWETHTKGFASKYLARFGFTVRGVRARERESGWVGCLLAGLLLCRLDEGLVVVCFAHSATCSFFRV